MKSVVSVITVILLAMAVMVMSGGCAAKTKPVAVAPQNVTGDLKSVSVSTAGGEKTLTVQTPQGVQSVRVAENTTYSINGKACGIDEIGQALAEGNTTYNCTVILDPCEPGIVSKYVSVFTVTQ